MTQKTWFAAQQDNEPHEPWNVYESGTNNYITGNLDKATAELIASAPDMLAMLKDLLTEMQGRAVYATRAAEVRIIQLINQIQGK